MALFGQSFRGFRSVAGVAAAVTLLAGASMIATAVPAQAQNHFRGYYGHGRGGPGFYGRGYYGRGFYGRSWYGGWYGWPGYAYWPYAPYAYAYYYPQYYYPQYVMPRAAYVMPPPPAAAPQPRQFTVFFDFDKYYLTPDARRVVDAAITEAQAGGPAHIEVVGNTDLAGTNSYNMVLSQHRAETVRNYMIAHGVDPREISIRALGKSDPAVRTADGVREPRNRRVEIVITPLRHREPPPMSMSRPPAMPADAMMALPPSGPVGAPTNLVGQ